MTLAVTLRKTAALGIIGVLAAASGTLALAASAEAAPSDTACAQVLAKPAPAGRVARENPGAFKAAEKRNAGKVDLNRADSSLWLDRCGDAFYVDPTPKPTERTDASTTMGAATAAAGLPLGGVPLADTFTLESKPGSNRTIYLDFDGGTVTGTAWNNSYGATIVADPYSIDSTVSTAFSDAELTEIQKTWQTVAEDYAPYDVNVTLKDPGAAAIDRTSSSDLVYGTRAMITNGGVVYNDCGCGGVAYVGVFNSTGSNHLYYQPAWVFSDGTTKNGKYIGEATSHEIGHNFGLNHDGTSTSGYYSGSAPWGPIMGASYSQPVSQWSKGEYPDANNFQDDLAQIATGAAFRADEDPAGALALGNGAALDGIITASTDADRYTFTAAGATTVTVANGSPFPDLDVQLRILDGNGTQVALVNPTTTRVSAVLASGMDASYSFTAPAGGATYTAEIRGAGQGAVPNAGAYSTYGSLGTYRVSLTSETPSGTSPLALTVGSYPAGTVGTAYSVDVVSASGGTAPYSYAASGLPDGLSIDAATGAVTGTPSVAGTFNATVTVTDALGGSAAQVRSLVVNPQAPPPPTFVTAATLPQGKVRSAYSTTISVTGGTPGYTWVRTSGSLPAGLTLTANGATATISGTPTKQGNSTFTLRVTDAAGQSVLRTFTLQIKR